MRSMLIWARRFWTHSRLFRVDVHEPDVFFYVELRDRINLYSRIIPGPGGMPVGTAGKAMLLLVRRH